jgi:hypothetical protein
MATNKPKSRYSPGATRKLRLPKIGRPKSKSLFEEYFYASLVIIFVVVAVLGIAGGMEGFNAVIAGLWFAVFTWFAEQLRRYFREKSSPATAKKEARAAKAMSDVTKMPLSPNLKPMIGPQWPLKTDKEPATTPGKPAPPGKKPVFVYQRPTLPDRKPRLPANWPGRQDKKPKQ